MLFVCTVAPSAILHHIYINTDNILSHITNISPTHDMVHPLVFQKSSIYIFTLAIHLQKKNEDEPSIHCNNL